MNVPSLVIHPTPPRSTLALALIAFLLPFPTARAQSAETRASLEAYRDTLASTADTVELGVLARRAETAARNFRSDSLLHLRVGFARLELARRTPGGLFASARDAFRRAAQLAPSWPYPHYGSGLAESGRGQWLADEPANLGTRVGYGAYAAAFESFLLASRSDPRLSAALLEAARIVEILRDTAKAQSALLVSRAAVQGGNDDPSVLLAHGRLERVSGDGTLAADAFERYAVYQGPLGLLELARTRLARGLPNGDSAYFAVAVLDDSLSVSGLRSDLVSIAREEELRAFDGARSIDRLEFLRRFWRTRDHLALRAEGERLREHYRRLLHARRAFALTINRRFYGSSDLYRNPDGEMDDRGVVYIRLGEPSKRVTPVMFGLMPNETWVYHRVAGDLVLHFSAGGQGTEGGDLHDFRLVPSIFDLRGSGVPADMLLLSRASVSDMYEKMLGWGPYGAARVAASERALGEASAAVATQTDGHELRYQRPLPLATDLVAIGQEMGYPRLHLLYAIPTTGQADGEPVRIRLNIFDRYGDAIIQLDTTDIPASLTGGFVGGRLTLTAPPGTWTFRLAVERSPDYGVVLPVDTLRIPEVTGSDLTISHLGLGQQRAGIRWIETQADTALLSPLRVFTPGSALHVNYQLYGLPSGQAYQTSIVIRERKHRGEGPIRLSFSFAEQVSATRKLEQKIVQLTGLAPGRYRVEVVVKTPSGGKTMAWKSINVVRPTELADALN